MQIGIVGLGRMGAGMARRLARGGVEVLCYDQAEAARAALRRRAEHRMRGEPRRAVRAPGRRARHHADRCRRATRSRTRSATSLPLVSSGDTSSTAATATTATPCAARSRCRSRGCATSTPASRAACTGCEHGYCLMLGGTPKSIEIFEPFARLLAPRSRARLAALRAERRRPLRQDDPQRHRVRDDAGARRRLRAARGAPRARHRRRRGSPRPGATAAWCARGCSISAPKSSRTTRSSPASRRWWPTRAKAAGPRSSRSSSACPRR